MLCSEPRIHTSHTGPRSTAAKPIYAGQTEEIHTVSTTSYVIGLDDNSAPLYIDVTLTVTGDSEPNGSATMFAAICFVIAALTIALLAYAAMKPKWAK